MLFLELIFGAYLIVVIIAVLMVFAAVDNRAFRGIFVFLGLIMPFILLYSIIASLFVRRRMLRFSEEFAKVEDEIESERLQIFGGQRVCPSFGEHWKRMYQLYLETVVDNVAKTSEKIASLGMRHAA